MTARFIAMTGLTVAALAVHGGAAGQARQQEQACAALTGWSGGPADLTITEARFYADRAVAARPGAEMKLPPHCHVEGSFERRTGVEGKSYAIGFAINLPAEWWSERPWFFDPYRRKVITFKNQLDRSSGASLVKVNPLAYDQSDFRIEHSEAGGARL